MILIYNCINDVHILYIHDKCLSICICTYNIYLFPLDSPNWLIADGKRIHQLQQIQGKGLFGMVKFFFLLPKNLIKKSIGDCQFFFVFEARLRCEGILCGQHCHPARPCSSNINQSGVAAATRRSKQRKRRAMQYHKSSAPPPPSSSSSSKYIEIIKNIKIIKLILYFFFFITTQISSWLWCMAATMSSSWTLYKVIQCHLQNQQQHYLYSLDLFKHVATN